MIYILVYSTLHIYMHTFFFFLRLNLSLQSTYGCASARVPNSMIYLLNSVSRNCNCKRANRTGRIPVPVQALKISNSQLYQAVFLFFLFFFSFFFLLGLLLRPECMVRASWQMHKAKKSIARNIRYITPHSCERKLWLDDALGARKVTTNYIETP